MVLPVFRECVDRKVSEQEVFVIEFLILKDPFFTHFLVSFRVKTFSNTKPVVALSNHLTIPISSDDLIVRRWTRFRVIDPKLDDTFSDNS